ncbi:hypothetical protein PHAVU_003G233100 [Phaseolus vulgaris]|uniref:DYW domain-containing protein n=1 Tax=Phaseolus vulgaris TaxID=3885 RepID=V7CEK7_PHAVU|nr:hypothetical protein PHAVU_003G233100g [Phaseolus vulgaris]ESW27798.1 hypothetical protein PHAVU_003G233100g [Phaseolus vulgaris]
MKRVFDAMPAPDRVSWNCLISGYAGRGFLIQSVKSYNMILNDGSFNLSHVFVGSSLVHMYSKTGQYFVQDRVLMKCPRRIWLFNTLSAGLMRCGRIEDWRQFGCNKLMCKTYYPRRGCLVSCRALISGLISFITVSNALVTYGKCGNIEHSHRLFSEIIFVDERVDHGFKPDKVTFIGILSACSRAGLVEEGNQILERKGIFIKMIPFRPDAIGWTSLSSTCRFYRNMEMAKWAGDSLVQLEPITPLRYVPDMNSVLHGVEDSEKIKMLNHHGEKLAINFGLIFIPRRLPMRVVKNLRVCGDCHNATKYMSKSSQREIHVGDTDGMLFMTNGFSWRMR